MVKDGVFGGGKHSQRIDADVLVETLVFGVDECLPKLRIHLFKFDWRAIFVEKFSDFHTVGTVNLGSLTDAWLQSRHKARRLAKQTEKIDIDHAEIDEKRGDER